MNNTMKVLVTGGAGFIGSNIVSELHSKGYEIIVIDNLQSGFKTNLASLSEIIFIEGDVRDLELLLKVSKGVNVIYHLAASVGNSRSIQHPIQDSEINVLGTINVLEAARRNDVNRIIYSSSAGIFGELKTLPIRENHPVEPDSPYGVSKLCGEKLCFAYAKLYDIEAMALRYFNVYGLNQRYDAYGNVIPILAQCILTGQPITIYGDGEQTRDFINVKDVVQANLRAAMARDASGAYNLGTGTRITINRLAEIMVEISGIPTTIEHGPPRQGDVRHSLADISAARDAFGFEPIVGLEEGLQEYFDWFREEMEK
jgi:UDP-glucose 4-epimerase